MKNNKTATTLTATTLTAADLTAVRRGETQRGKATRLLASLLAAALLSTACSGSASDSSGLGGPGSSRDDSEISSEDLAGRGGNTSTDQEADLGRVDEDAYSDTPAEDYSEESEDAATEESAPSTSTEAGGLFGTTESPAEQTHTQGNVFENYGVRSFIETERDSLSTFALDVDSASYDIGREYLTANQLPPSESVRVEEYINAFEYDYPSPRDGLGLMADAGPSPFNPDNIIVRVGVQAEQVRYDDRADVNLTFVVDTSGSMDRSDRLGLVKVALRRLVAELDGDDTVSIVTYSDSGDIILPPTSIRDSDTILDAIDDLRPGGSTNLEAGLAVGYELASEAFVEDAINRVVLASDGVANVGMTDPDGLVQQIRDDADRGIQLVTVGVGMGNYNDVVMETLANDGDGFYSYVNTEEQAEKLFSDDLMSSLVTVAIDGKIQVDFDTEVVKEYRLLGFENRAVHDDDFRNDDVDAGELGSGHQVTALYELKLRDGESSNVSGSARLGTVSLRWEDPDTHDVRENRLELTGAILESDWFETAEDFRLAITVATYAEVLRQSQYATDVELKNIAEEAHSLRDRSPAVVDLAELIYIADRLS